MRREFFVPCPLGLESVTEQELAELGALELETRPAGVHFRGEQKLAYVANLWLRSAIRVQELLGRFRAGSPNEVYDGVAAIDWTRFMGVDDTLAVDASVRNSEIRHSKYAALVVKDAIVDQFRDRFGKRPSVDRNRPLLPLKLVVDGQAATLWRDYSGASLHKRGWRPIQVKSPLNEVTAAALLLASAWDRKSPLVDPMCGSGTFVIEAALLAAKRAPGLLRQRWPFEFWPDFDPRAWENAQRDAEAESLDELGFVLEGADCHGGAIELARQGARAAGVASLVRFYRNDASVWRPSARRCFVVTNPPYGTRLGRGGDLVESWQSLGRFLHELDAGSEAWVLSGNRELTRHLGLRASARIPVQNGGIDCRWLQYEISAQARQGRPAAGELAVGAAQDPAGIEVDAGTASRSGDALLAEASEREPDDAGRASRATNDGAAVASSHPSDSAGVAVELDEGEHAACVSQRGAISRWVAKYAALVSEGPVLDLACGAGRHTKLFVDRGHEVVAVDRDLEALGILAKHRLVVPVEADLEDGSPWPLPGQRFAGIVVCNYLWRPLLRLLVESLEPGGILIYETFALGQERHGKPSNPDFLLRPNELLEAFAGELEVLAYEHGEFEEPDPVVRQRICARRSPASDGAA